MTVMKNKLLLFAVALMMAFAASAQSQLFKACENAEGITTVYITKAMLKMAGEVPGIGLPDKSLLQDKIDKVEIITSDNAEGRTFIDRNLPIITGDKAYELLMKVSDDKKEDVKIYRGQLKGGKYSYVIINKSPEESAVIIIDGSLTVEDVMRCTKR